MTNFEKVKEWHKIFAPQLIKESPSIPDDNHRDLRLSLIQEEVNELYEADHNNDILGIADALADLLYVTYGMGVSYGLPMDEVFEEVQRSNMSKLGENGEPLYREDGKVLKGPNFSKPDINKILFK